MASPSETSRYASSFESASPVDVNACVEVVHVTVLLRVFLHLVYFNHFLLMHLLLFGHMLQLEIDGIAARGPECVYLYADPVKLRLLSQL